jgi:hypothetical protein
MFIYRENFKRFTKLLFNLLTSCREKNHKILQCVTGFWNSVTNATAHNISTTLCTLWFLQIWYAFLMKMDFKLTGSVFSLLDKPSCHTVTTPLVWHYMGWYLSTAQSVRSVLGATNSDYLKSEISQKILRIPHPNEYFLKPLFSVVATSLLK